MTPLISQTLEKLSHLYPGSPTSTNKLKLKELLQGREYEESLRTLTGDDLMRFVEYLDKAVDAPKPRSAVSRKLLSDLKKICGNQEVLPSSYTVPSLCLTVARSEPQRYSRIPIPRVRLITAPDPSQQSQVNKAFFTGAITWKRLKHPNIVPILSFGVRPLEIISLWMPNGNLLEYIKEHPSADLVALLSDAARGLKYLHSCDVIHQAIKGTNVLVDDTCHARIADFGLAAVNPRPDHYEMDDGEAEYSLWTAPEVLKGQWYNEASDIFSFGMLMVEVFTRKCPDPQLSFHEVRSAISCGPPWPTLPDVTEPLWGLMQQCLDEDPGSRPNALEVLRALTSQVRSSRKSAHLERSQHRTTMKTRFDVLRFLGLGGGLGLGRTESCL